MRRCAALHRAQPVGAPDLRSLARQVTSLADRTIGAVDTRRMDGSARVLAAIWPDAVLTRGENQYPTRGEGRVRPRGDDDPARTRMCLAHAPRRHELLAPRAAPYAFGMDERRTLLVPCHAQSEDIRPGSRDSERRLTRMVNATDGERDEQQIGNYLGEQGIMIDEALCSNGSPPADPRACQAR
jgi:hypothetical protein